MGIDRRKVLKGLGLGAVSSLGWAKTSAGSDLGVAPGAANSAPSTAQSGTRPTKDYDVAAYVWPSYHPDERARIFWPMGIGEWETVMKNKPKFEGHKQPRHPLWGYVNEADPHVMEMEIDAAADHGVNVFIFDWYWYDGMPFLEGSLDNGYLKARNNSRVKFYLMWANHDVRLVWDRRNADDAFTGKNRALIWRGWLGREEFEKIARKWIKEYFSQPSYYKMNGKPVFMIYDLSNFVKGMGSVKEAREALDWFRKQTVEAGHKGLELQVALRRESSESLSTIERLNFDSATHYQFVHFVELKSRFTDYNQVVKDAVAEWNNLSSRLSAQYYPHVSIGWDASPRAISYVGNIITNNTPENFQKALIEAKKFVDDRPTHAPLITVNSWNEWTETSYLEPDDMHGYGYLEAVKRAFKG